MFARSPEVDEAERALQFALVVVFAGERFDASPSMVADAIGGLFGFPAEVFSIHRHAAGMMLIYFAAMEDGDRVLADRIMQSPYFRMRVQPWSRRTNTTAGSLGVHVNLEIEGVRANAWSIAAAETMLAPNSWVERLDPLTRSRADMEVFRLSAWCLDPALIPKEIDFHVVEPVAAPSAATMAAPTNAITGGVNLFRAAMAAVGRRLATPPLAATPTTGAHLMDCRTATPTLERAAGLGHVGSAVVGPATTNRVLR
uniref:Uncharacterized protein n=1 Tax=Avena sativa TaxID=4498 RepID=A0ACD5VBX5_AVESA